MSKRDKLLINDIAAVQPGAQWTLGRTPTGKIKINDVDTPYWMPDGVPITLMNYGEVQGESTKTSEDVPF